jgi:tubulin polyglutamylase TTLL6/13
MKWHQRTNHLPAVHVIAKKNSLARNLALMQRAMPEQYDFFPQTWQIPMEAKAFKE